MYKDDESMDKYFKINIILRIHITYLKFLFQNIDFKVFKMEMHIIHEEYFPTYGLI